MKRQDFNKRQNVFNPCIPEDGLLNKMTVRRPMGWCTECKKDADPVIGSIRDSVGGYRIMVGETLCLACANKRGVHYFMGDEKADDL